MPGRLPLDLLLRKSVVVRYENAHITGCGGSGSSSSSSISGMRLTASSDFQL